MSVVQLNINGGLLVHDTVSAASWRMSNDLVIVDDQFDVLWRLLSFRNRLDLTISANRRFGRQKNGIICLTLDLLVN